MSKPKSEAEAEEQPPLLPKRPAVCSVAGCGRQHHARGLCKRHYHRARIDLERTA